MVEGSALEVPFPDGHFDLVFTAGVLIHIAPADLPRALTEIHRVAKTWIWGSEYCAPSLTQIKYRGHDELLWRNDFSRRYLEKFPDLQLLREERLPCLNNPNTDTMFLVQRTW
jgi:ubiquinone/menaquinone biosynthesis C-methylase UbiE